jgi:hypothetical protein
MSSDPIRGKTFHWTFTDGPMKGKTFEHAFGTEGRVSWRSSDDSEAGDNMYEIARVNDHVYAVSYRGSSGSTLTTVLDMKTCTLVSFASNDHQLVVQRGTFDTVARAA